MQISFPMSKYSKKRREGVELRDLGHINLLPKVLCDPVHMYVQSGACVAHSTREKRSLSFLMSHVGTESLKSQPVMSM